MSFITQLQDICEIKETVPESAAKCQEGGNDSKDEVSNEVDEKAENDISHTTTEENDDNQLICFGGNTGTDEKLDGLTLDDLNGMQIVSI